MLKTKKTLSVLLLAVFLFISGCGGQESKTSFKHESGIHFDFPEGWSILSKKEWRDMDLGKDKTLVTIMNESRNAGFSLIPIGLDSEMQFALGMLGNENAARIAMAIEAINAAGPKQYKEYRLIKKGATEFAGVGMGEIIYQGRNPVKELKWYRVLMLALPNTDEAMIMFVFTAPMGKQDTFKNDFTYIENNWKWRN